MVGRLDVYGSHFQYLFCSSLSVSVSVKVQWSRREYFLIGKECRAFCVRSYLSFAAGDVFDLLYRRYITFFFSLCDIYIVVFNFN